MSVNVPLWIIPAAKKTEVKVGPKKIWPNAAFCNVDIRDVEGKTLKIMAYHALAAGPKNSRPLRFHMSILSEVNGR